MITMKRSMLLILFLSLITTSTIVQAGDRPASKRAMSFLQLGAGPRAYAMGEAFSGLVDDVTALSWNPAGLAQISDPQILFMHNQWIANLRQEYLAGAYPIFDGCAAAQFSFLNSDIQLTRDEDGLLTGESFNPYSFMGGLSFAMSFDYGISAGASLNYAQEQLEDVSYNTVFVDMGGMFRLPQAWWSVGVGIQNLGLPVAGYSLPFTLRVGAAARLFNDSLNITAETARAFPGWFRYSVGAEFWYRNLFAFRTGYLYRPEHEGLDTLSGLRAGLGFNIQGYQMDYAFIPQGDLGYGHRAGFTYFFGGGRALTSEKQDLINKAYKAGEAALAAKKHQKAIDNFQKVLTFQPNDQAAQKSLQAAQKGRRQQEKNAELRDRFAQAEKYQSLGQLQDAMDEYQRILVVDEGNSRAARSFARLKKKFQAKEVAKHLKAGRTAYKKLRWVDALLAWQAVLAITVKHKEAAKMLKKTREQMAKGSKRFKDPRIKEWYLQGLALFEKGDYYGATRKWQRVLKIAPKHKRAKKYMYEATRLLDEKVTSLITAGDKYLKNGDLIRAAARWRRVLMASPKHTKVLAKLKANQAAFKKIAKKLHLKGIRDYTQGQFKQAVANWQDVLILAPDYSGAKDNIRKARAKLKAIQK